MFGSTSLSTWHTDSYQSEGSINESLFGRPLSMEIQVEPLTLGVVSEPPTLVLIYEEVKSDGILGLDDGNVKRKKRKRKIPLRQFTDKSNAEKFARNIRIRHESYLGAVPIIMIEKMLRIIQEIIKGLHPDEAATKVYSEYAINPDEDLNKLSLEEVSRKKLIMEETFEKNRLKPTDPGYKYDKQIDFDRAEKIKSGWDEDNEDEEEGEGGDIKKTEALRDFQPTNVHEKPGVQIKEINDSDGIMDESNIIETIVDNDDEDDFW